ncbi:MAG: hypothetical protein H7Z14_13970 [Anaerolineae bacterium]|nr:hypothetical protein [Phycisphaerae bacterium]
MSTDNGRIELAILIPEALPAQVHKVVTDVVQGGYAGAVVPPVYVSRAATMVRGSGATVNTTVGFPHGTNKPTLKAIEATSSIKDGADAVMIVAHLPHLIRGDFDAARAELLEIVRAARATRREVQINVIIESAMLMQQHDGERLIATACRAIRESGCDGVASATGFHPAGAGTEDAIRAIRRHAESLIVVASGNIAASEAQRYLAAGADRTIVDAALSSFP